MERNNKQKKGKKTLNKKANNLEEICCGIGNNIEWFKSKKRKVKLIKEIEAELEVFNEALKEFKKII